MEGESGVTRSIIDEPHTLHIEGDQMEGQSGVSWFKFFLRISKDIKRKVKVVFLEVSLTNLVVRIGKAITWKVKEVLLEVSLMNVILWISK